MWAVDITYLPMARGFLYLVVIMDWHSRYVVAWRPSNTLDAGFCAEALEDALARGKPEVFNTDRGSQFTSREFTQVLQEHGVKVSMDGKGRYSVNIFVERLWRTVKYEEVYLKACADAHEARKGLEDYFPVLQPSEAPSVSGLPGRRPRCSTESRDLGKRNLMKGGVRRVPGQHYWQERRDSHLTQP